MESFGLYSLKAGIILTLFWGIYRLFLQKETFFRFNRYFLLTGLIASLILPLYTIHYTVEVKAPVIPVHMISESEIPATATGTVGFYTFIDSCISLLPVIYITVLLIMLIVRFIGLSRIIRIIRRNNHMRYSNYNLIESSEFDGAFSFFRFVFIQKNMSETDKIIILKHEKTHIEQSHWVDLLLTNILGMIWWFNPIIWLYEKSIMNNHEYLADKEALSQHNQADYQQLLVSQWLKIPVFPMTNSFSCSNYLKRITIMKKNISNPAKKLFSLIVIPTIAIFFMAFSEPEYKYYSTETTSENTVIHEVEMRISTDTITPITKNLSLIGRSPVIDTPLIILDDNKISNNELNSINPEDIYSITVLKDVEAINKYGDEANNGVIIITTKKNVISLSAASVYEIKGSIVNVSGNPISRALIKISDKNIYSDQNGSFSINISSGDILTIDAEGYESKVIQTDKNVKLTSIQIIMQEKK